MTWRDQLRDGRFREARFQIRAGMLGFGRRAELHEYPLRDTPYAEDLGRQGRDYELEVFVVGPDYMQARDDLIDALEKPGPGTLIHPTLGSLQVVAISARLRESTHEGGMAIFSLRFVEAGAPALPDQIADTQGLVSAASDAAEAAVSGDFSEEFTVDGFANFVADEAQTLTVDILATIEDLSSLIPTTPETLTQFQKDFSDISNAVASLIRQPANLASEIIGIVRSFSDIATRPVNALKLYRVLFDIEVGAKPVVGATPARQQQAANQSSLFALVRQAAIIGAVDSSAAIDYESSAQAIAARDELAVRLDDEMLAVADTSYRALSHLRMSLVRDLMERGARLPNLIRIENLMTQPALVIAQRIYGDASRADEIVTRNQIRHPGFVPGGQTLEVLADG